MTEDTTSATPLPTAGGGQVERPVRPLVDRLRTGVYGIDRIALCAEAADEIDRLQAELARLTKPAFCCIPCQSHRYHSYTMEMQLYAWPPMKTVCPVCEGVGGRRPASTDF